VDLPELANARTVDALATYVLEHCRPNVRLITETHLVAIREHLVAVAELSERPESVRDADLCGHIVGDVTTAIDPVLVGELAAQLTIKGLCATADPVDEALARSMRFGAMLA
jgi:hypothetical protein